MTQIAVGVQTSSTAVTTTAVAPVATSCFVVRTEYGALVAGPAVTLFNASVPYEVSLTGYTASLPDN